jgi:DNA-binding response OmpR family regulator
MPSRLRVLIADDERPIRLLCRVNLEAEGMTVVEAVDGEDALAAIAADVPDVAVLDVMMPGLDGWEVARRLRAASETAELPLVFLTAVSHQDAAVHVAELHGVYVAKPFNPVELPAAIRRALIT